MRLSYAPNIAPLAANNPLFAKVLDVSAFKKVVLQRVTDAIATQMADEDGEWHVNLGNDALPLVSSGIGKIHGHKSTDYVVHMHRGRPRVFLKREFALPPEKCFVTVVSTETYFQNVEMFDDLDAALTKKDLEEFTHVVVSVRIHAGPVGIGIWTRPEQFIALLAKYVGDPEKAMRACNEAWRIDTYWRDFIEVAD